MSERGKRGRGEETKAEGKRERRRGMGKKKERDYCESSVTNFRSLARVCNRLLRWGGRAEGGVPEPDSLAQVGEGRGDGERGRRRRRQAIIEEAKVREEEKIKNSKEREAGQEKYKEKE